MRKIYMIVLLAILVFSGYQLNAQVNVISYNIRYNNAGDGEHAWPKRSEGVVRLLKFHKADIFCLQEALHDQVLELDAAFPEFSYTGVGRDDGKQMGEYAPVFFNALRFKQEDAGHFWLSETPEKPGLGWDAACIRICTWIQLEEVSTGKQVMVFNTHFDHVGMEARKNAADLILKEIMGRAKDKAVVLCGDFNLPPESVPIQKLSAVLHDSYLISELEPHGASGTWSGFTYDDKSGDRIDYIFVSDGIRVLRYAALTDSRNRSYFSDHLPVLVEIGY